MCVSWFKHFLESWRKLHRLDADHRTRYERSNHGFIDFKDFIDNSALPQTLARASVCVFPSHMEAQGIVIVEGMAMGKAVGAGGTGPGPELIEDEISGMLCNPHVPDSIAEKAISLLKDAPLRRQIGARARSRAVSKFSVETLAGRNADFYRCCVENRREA